MIAIDTSSFVAFLTGETGPDVDAVDLALAGHQACLPPLVLVELLSDPALAREVIDAIRRLPMLPMTDGFWDRAGTLRASAIRAGRRAKVGDTLIAQCCLDNEIPLVTRDRDFRLFAKVGGLQLAVPA